MQLHFEEATLWQKRKQEVFQRIDQAKVPLVLFGDNSAVNYAFLDEIEVPVSYICDNNPAKQDQQRQNRLQIISPDRIPEIYAAYTVLILVPFEDEIRRQLKGLSIPPTEIFRLDFYFEEADTAAYFQRVQADLNAIYERLADAESKETFEAVIRYRMTRNPELIKPVALQRNLQYFPDTLGGKKFLGSNEVFVDVGAFIGDTVMTFCDAVQGNYQAIYAFEPGPENFKKLLDETRNFSRLHCKQTAASDHAETLHFTVADSDSRATAAGEITVPADTLDHLLDGVPVSYLKMDVEGMECAALRGAKKLIQKYRPRLAVCTYHSNADMVEVPKLIWELNPDYQLYFRHYTHALVETVCYAV